MQIASIQVLRAVAALLVAFGHGQGFIGIPMERLGQSFGWNYLLPWGAGVDLFFVISGFIMVYSSERLYARPGGTRIFVFRRLARIVPLYWALTSFIVLIRILLHKPGHDAADVLASLLFLPWDTAGTGVPRPVFELGWTLNYEMFFYALFSLTLVFSREVSGFIIVVMLTTLSLAGWIFQPAQTQIFFWTQPIILEFALGVLLALAARRSVTFPFAVRIALIFSGVGGLFFDLLQSGAHPQPWTTPNDIWRVIGWGVPCAMIFAGVVLKPATKSEPAAPIRTLSHLGDASYALYLCHPIVMSVFASLWFALRLGNGLNAWIAVGSSVLLSIGAALLIYRLFELPVTRALQNRTSDTKAVTGAAE